MRRAILGRQRSTPGVPRPGLLAGRRTLFDSRILYCRILLNFRDCPIGTALGPGPLMIMDVGRVVHTFALTLVLAWCITPSSAQPSKPEIDRLADLWPALSACWRPPAGSDGMEITLRFSLTRRGAILGEPRITYSKLNGPPRPAAPSVTWPWRLLRLAHPSIFRTASGCDRRAPDFDPLYWFGFDEQPTGRILRKLHSCWAALKLICHLRRCSVLACASDSLICSFSIQKETTWI